MILNKIFNIVFVIVLFFPADTFGQSSRFEIGLEGGASLSNYSGFDSRFRDFIEVPIQLRGGISLQYNLSEFISIKTNVVYKRFRLKNSIQSTDEFGTPNGMITSNSDSEYLRAPILLRFSLGERWKYFLNVGPYFSYLIKSNISMIFPNEEPELNINTLDNFKRIDYGISAGFGFGFPISEKIFTSFEFRSNFGLYNISAIKVASPILQPLNTRSLNLIWGIVYQLKSKKLEN